LDIPDVDVRLLLMPKFLATRQQRGMAIFLCADLFIFLALFASYLYLRQQVPQWPGAFHFGSGLMAFAITMFAISSSITMFYATRHQASESYEISMRLVVATIAVLGTVFILLAMEWMRLLFIVEVSVPAFNQAYFGLTGFYGLHILIVLIYLTVLAVKIRRTDVGSATLFVHFTNIVWLFILFGVYFASADLKGI
jgi:heme/copper-type cytochrome/quinol oxidase subunit 3